MQTILLVFGTRPEGIKMAPLYHALKEGGQFCPLVAVTGQHREMLDQVLELFQMPAHYDLNIMRQDQSLTDITIAALAGLEKVLKDTNPQMVLVHGDTTTTVAGSLAAFYQQIPVGHVEAGLRSFDTYNPYPEEMNRRLTAHLANLHFAPTCQAKTNLQRENIPSGQIFVTGNTVIDALLSVHKAHYTFQNPILRSIDFRKRIIVITIHRRENWGKPLLDILQAIKAIPQQFSDVELVFSLHKNPQVRGPIQSLLGGQPRIHLIEPPPYQEFANLLARCHLVLTDSGGLQEEAPALGKPVLVLRNTTERPEGIQAGTVELVGTEKTSVFAGVARLLAQPEAYAQMAKSVNPYGDGYASQRIVSILKAHFGLDEGIPPEYLPGR